MDEFLLTIIGFLVGLYIWLGPAPYTKRLIENEAENDCPHTSVDEPHLGPVTDPH